jgi:hypothetical protein
MDTAEKTIAGAPSAASAGVGTGTMPLVVTEEEAGRMLRLSVRTMQRLRLDGDGPRFVRLTGRRIGYSIGDLQKWVQRRSVASTAEATVRARAGSAT